MSQLAKNVYRMDNAELIGLAKNRFLDSETQLKIAEHPYRRAKTYLAENAGLSDAARDHLWNMRGYVFKAALLSFGHYELLDEFYHELYNDHGDTMRYRSPWRLHRCFVGGYGYSSSGWGALPGPRACPPEILEDIYEKDVAAKNLALDWNARSTLRGLLNNPNLPTDIVVKVSASHPDSDIRNMALKRLGTLK
jgi:hypothetical protein